MNKKQTPTEKSTLNDYHIKRNKDALKAVEEMKKQPYSSEQMRTQIQRSLNS